MLPGFLFSSWLVFGPRLLGFTGFPSIFQAGTRITCELCGLFSQFLLIFFLVVTIFTGFYWILLGFNRVYWVLLDFTGVYWVLMGFYWVLLKFTEFY